MTLGEKIAFLRKELNLTQQKLANKLFVSRNAISKWETNYGYPNIESLLSLSKIFGVTLEELISDENLKKLEKENGKKYHLYGFMNILLLFAGNALIARLTPDSISMFELLVIIFLRFLLIVSVFYIDFFFLRRKFLSRKQRRLALKIDAFMVIFLVITIITAVFAIVSMTI